MVLESIITPWKAERNLGEIFFIGFVYATVGLFMAFWVFRQYSSLIMVLLTVMVSVPLVYRTIKDEEEKDIVYESERKILKEHARALTMLTFLFLGFVAAFSFWYVVLPSDHIFDMYSVQTSTIDAINNRISGNVMKFDIFIQVLLNNVKVLSFCVLFAFVYGVGAIFILTWNASVVGAAIGNFIRNNLTNFAHLVGFDRFAAYLNVISLGFLRYMLHGIPEMAAYFVGGLAGGIISIAVIKHDFRLKKFENIIFDSSELITIALLMLFLAAILEVYVTPLLF